MDYGFADSNRKGDYHRYLAEFALGDKRKESADKSLEAYKAASDVAVTELPPTHPVYSPTPKANQPTFPTFPQKAILFRPSS